MRDYRNLAALNDLYEKQKATALKKAAAEEAAEETKINNSKYFVLYPSDLEGRRRLKTYRIKRD
jgi:hypothetical protein